MTPNQRALAARLAKTQPVGYTERYGKIVSVSAGVATVTLSGDTTNLPGMRVASSITVSAGQTVIIRIKGSDAYVAERLT